MEIGPYIDELHKSNGFSVDISLSFLVYDELVGYFY